MRITTFILLIALSNLAFSQNYIVNPSFEILSDCPKEYSQLNLAPPWETPTNGTPDLFNTCDTMVNSVGVPDNFMGYLYPHDGNTYAGIHFVYEYNYREYLKTELKDCLRRGQEYYISFWVSLAGKNNSPISTEFLGIHISDDDIFFNQREVIPLVSNVTFIDTFTLNTSNSWVKMEATYIASGNEKYMVIGNFHKNSDIPFNSNKLGTYLFFDDFKFTNTGSHFTSTCDKIICRGDSVLLEAYSINHQQVRWLDENKSIISNTQSVWVSPQINSKYYLEIKNVILDSINILIKPRPKEHTRLLIECDTQNYRVYIESTEPFYSILWSNGKTGSLSFETPNESGWVYLINKYFCEDTIEFDSDSCSFFICEGEALMYNSNYSGVNPEWYFHDMPNEVVMSGTGLLTYPEKSGTYFLRDQGLKVDSIKVYILISKDFDLNIACQPNGNEVKITNPYGSALWSDGKRDTYHNIMENGPHWVELENVHNCILRKDFFIPKDCNTISLCPNDSVLLSLNSSESGFWRNLSNGEKYFNSSDFYVFPDTNTSYIFSGTDGSNRLLTVDILEDYQHEIEVNCVDQKAEIKIKNPNGYISWENGVFFSTKQFSSPDNSWVQTKRTDGCIFREDIYTEKSCLNSYGIEDMFVPNIITPNQDGMNDEFVILSFLKNIELIIYNQWGREVFHSHNYKNDWQADGLASGIYYFLIKDPKLREDFKGWVEVLR